MNIFISASVVVVVSVLLVMLVRRNLRQRVLARRLREVFTAAANDLIGKAEFPDSHAAQLVEFSVVPGGWLTRYMVAVLIGRIVMGRENKPRVQALSLQQVPPALRTKYVMAILALGLSDSYRCAILGRVWRGAYSWVPEAVEEAKPDVEAHATRSIIAQMFNVHAPRQYQATSRRLECAA